MDLGFDGRVAIITGGGGGLGRAHALALASRGARVVVNDLGSSVDGSGGSSAPAQRVVDEICAAGGEAVADMNSVATPAGGDSVVATAFDAFGRVDIVVNNAGILRDQAFHKMTSEQFDIVLDVHLRGAFHVTRAAWPHLREQRFGRVVNTSSAAGILGNFGQANYGAAKMGLVGLTNVLAVEGARFGITVNAISPFARSRMTEDVLGRLVDRLDPALVSPLVAWLCHDDCDSTGQIFTVGGGRVARFFVGMTSGWSSGGSPLSIEDVRDHFAEIQDTDGASVANSIVDDLGALKRSLV